MTSRHAALVTGGAGLIGSHIVDGALAAGWDVRILDNLQRQTHREGKPVWVPREVDFIKGDVRNRRTWERALDGIDVVFHQAAYGGYMPEIAKFIESNGVGTALMLETIRDKNLPVRKVVVASSQAVYNEGAYRCPEHGRFYGTTRPIAQLERGDWDVHCPLCAAVATPVPTDEAAPTGGENVYAISKLVQERLVISWGRATGIPAVALRYSCTYGPRQSLFNPYTGVIAIFCTRLANDLPPVVYEDGRQSRDLIFVEDVAQANLLVADDPRADGQIFNVGTGQAAAIGDLASCSRSGWASRSPRCSPASSGQVRCGPDHRRLAPWALGFAPRTSLGEGIDRYLDWVRAQGSIGEYFAAAERMLRRRRVVKQAAR